MIFWLLPISIVGARLYYVIFNLDYYAKDLISIFKVWEGGLAIHGGIITGLIFVIFYCKKHKVNTFLVSDITVVSLIIAQAIGRWGNFFNSEAYGSKVTLDFLKGIYLPQFIIDGMYINGVYYHPTFLYEFIWNFVGFIIMVIIRRTRYIKKGQITAFYLMWYSFGRFFIESLRMDSLMFKEFKVAQIMSVVLFIIGFILFIVFGKGSRFDNRYKEEGGSTSGASEIVY